MGDRPHKRPRFGEPDGFALSTPDATKPKPKFSLQTPRFESSFEPKKRKEPEAKNLHFAIRPPPKFVIPAQQQNQKQGQLQSNGFSPSMHRPFPAPGAGTSTHEGLASPMAVRSVVRPPPVFHGLKSASTKPEKALKRLVPPTLPVPPPPKNPVKMKPPGIPNFVLPRPPTPPPFTELDRGLERSPEKKKDRHGRPVYKRGGLAAYASAYLQRHHTSLMTWRREVESPRIPSAGPSMHVRIIKIISQPKPEPRSPKAKYRPLPVIAVCQDQKSYMFHTLVFEFSPALKPHDKRLLHFCVGSRAEIWTPWRHAKSRAMAHYQPLPMPTLTPSSTPDGIAEALKDIITCSKFNIRPG